MKSIAAGTLTALMVTTAAAQRDAYSANAVLPGCKSFIALVEGRKSNETFMEVCEEGFCAGVLNTINALIGPTACVPPNVTVMQGLRVVVRYIEARPQRMHESFVEFGHRGVAQRVAVPQLSGPE